MPTPHDNPGTPFDVCGSVAELVDTALPQLGISKAELATRIGVSPDDLTRLSTQGVTPSQRVVVRILGVLAAQPSVAFSPDQLLYRLGYISSRDLDLNGFSPEELGRWLLTARQYAGLTRQEVCDLTEISISGLTKIEEGRSAPRPHIVARIHRVTLAEHPESSIAAEIPLAAVAKQFRLPVPNLELSDCSTFGETVQAARVSLGLSLGQAAVGGLTADELGHVERGLRNISNGVALALASELRAAFNAEFSADDCLEQFGYVTARSLHPRNYEPYEAGIWARRVRAYRGMTVAELAELVYRSRKSANSYETGARPVPEDYAATVYRAARLGQLSHTTGFIENDVLEKFSVARQLVEQHLPSALGVAARRAADVDPLLAESLVELAALSLLREVDERPDDPNLAAYVLVSSRHAIGQWLDAAIELAPSPPEARFLRRVAAATALARDSDQTPAGQAIALALRRVAPDLNFADPNDRPATAPPVSRSAGRTRGRPALRSPAPTRKPRGRH